MHKKYLVSALIPALLIQLYGCYSMTGISKDKIPGLKEGGDLVVYTKDSKIYFFEKSNYSISKDSLYGKGYVKFTHTSEFILVNECAVALADIESIQQDRLNLVTTGILAGGVLLVVIVGIMIVFPSHDSIVTPYIPAY